MLARPYVVLRIPEMDAEVWAKTKGQGSLAGQGSSMIPPLEGWSLGKAIMNQYANAGAGALGFHVAGVKNRDFGFANEMDPSGILEVTVGALGLKTETSRDERYGAVKSTISVEQRRGRADLSGKSQWYTPQGQKLGQETAFSVFLEGAISDDSQLNHWFNKEKNRLWDLFAVKAAQPPSLSAQYGSKIRYRAILPSKMNPKIQEGFDLAKQKNWDKAAGIWKEVAFAQNHPSAYHNLAVYYESQGSYDLALKNYQAAKAAYARVKGDMEYGYLFPYTWDHAIDDLEMLRQNQEITARTAAKPALSAQPQWFSKKTAVLPLTNESNFVDAPLLLRRLIEERLRQQGYSVIDPGVVDEALRTQGATEGAHLAVLSSKKIAELLKADYLVYGQIHEFNEVPLGVYHKREVGLTLELHAAGTGEVLWKARKKILKEEGGAKGKEAFGLAVLQLVKGLAERIGKFPLKEESAQLVSAMLSMIPAR